jgi:hypothetical protein
VLEGDVRDYKIKITSGTKFSTLNFPEKNVFPLYSVSLQSVTKIHRYYGNST